MDRRQREARRSCNRFMEAFDQALLLKNYLWDSCRTKANPLLAPLLLSQGTRNHLTNWKIKDCELCVFHLLCIVCVQLCLVQEILKSPGTVIGSRIREEGTALRVMFHFPLAESDTAEGHGCVLCVGGCVHALPMIGVILHCFSAHGNVLFPLVLHPFHPKVTVQILTDYTPNTLFLHNL